MLQLIEAGAIDLLRSSVLAYENSRNPFALRQRWVHRCHPLARQIQQVDDGIRARAEELGAEGFGAVECVVATTGESP